MVAYAHSEVLVDTQWVENHLNDPQIRIVEVGYKTNAYNEGHIPGAVGWAWSTDFQHPVRKDIPDKEGIETLLSRSGIENDTTIVAYGTPKNAYATYTRWLLKIYGHADVRIMNGARDKWLAEGRSMTTEVPTITPVSYQTKDPDWSIRALHDHVLESLGRPDRVIVDVRTPEEYHGELWDMWKYQAEASQRGGHIPGAINIPWDMVYNENTTFKSAEELRALYADHGVTPDKEIVIYCIVGGRSNNTWFVLSHLLGFPNVRLYDGSWAEWGTLVGVPIER